MGFDRINSRSLPFCLFYSIMSQTDKDSIRSISIELELAIDPPPPLGEFCTLSFSETTLYKKQNDTC